MFCFHSLSLVVSNWLSHNALQRLIYFPLTLIYLQIFGCLKSHEFSVWKGGKMRHSLGTEQSDPDRHTEKWIQNIRHSLLKAGDFLHKIYTSRHRAQPLDPSSLPARASFQWTIRDLQNSDKEFNCIWQEPHGALCAARACPLQCACVCSMHIFKDCRMLKGLLSPPPTQGPHVTFLSVKPHPTTQNFIAYDSQSGGDLCARETGRCINFAIPWWPGITALCSKAKPKYWKSSIKQKAFLHHVKHLRKQPATKRSAG